MRGQVQPTQCRVIFIFSGMFETISGNFCGCLRLSKLPGGHPAPFHQWFSESRRHLQGWIQTFLGFADPWFWTGHYSDTGEKKRSKKDTDDRSHQWPSCLAVYQILPKKDVFTWGCYSLLNSWWTHVSSIHVRHELQSSVFFRILIDSCNMNELSIHVLKGNNMIGCHISCLPTFVAKIAKTVCEVYPSVVAFQESSCEERQLRRSPTATGQWKCAWHQGRLCANLHHGELHAPRLLHFAILSGSGWLCLGDVKCPWNAH